MQIVKKLIGILMIFGFIKPVLALPPFQILRTCMDGKPYDPHVTILELDEAGGVDKPLEGCEDQYEFEFNRHKYGMLTCDNKFYLIINDKKIDPALATDNSINPEIKPGVEFTSRAIWYKIGYANKEYQCIFAPLAEQGIGAAHNQYYIIENAFDTKLDPKLFFYFSVPTFNPFLPGRNKQLFIHK